MKRIIIITLLALVWTTDMATAQNTPAKRPRHFFSHNKVGAEEITLRSTNNETFTAYIDGKPQNARSRREIILQGISAQPHTLYIRIQSPVDRIGAIPLSPSDIGHTFNITYDPVNDIVVINDPLNSHSHTNTTGYIPSPNASYSGYDNPHQPIHPPHATPEELSEIINMMNSASYDSERLTLGKTFLKGHPCRTDQIMRMSQTINFDNNRLEFLIFAFEYCLDKEDYYKATDMLTYKSSKNKLLKRINQ